MKLLVELRPALAGYAGIPQETRLLFACLAKLHGLSLSGLLPSRSAVMCSNSPPPAWWRALRLSAAAAEALGHGLLQRPSQLRALGPRDERIDDQLWQRLFAKTLPSAERHLLEHVGFMTGGGEWAAAHLAGVLTGALGRCVHPVLDTRAHDVFIAETPFPGSVSAGTTLIVRYHDAVPVRMAHTLRHPRFGRAAHQQALRRNAAEGAWFACVSETTRQELLALHPELAPRAVTVPNILAPGYVPTGAPSSEVARILDRRTAVRGIGVDGPGEVPEYLLMVSTLEPRKNHHVLIDAWQRLLPDHPGLHLVLVGAAGWQHESLLQSLRPLIASGRVHWLQQVPVDEMRTLYSYAAATVCPSLGEGFGYSGLEAMACGGVVVASELPVHREVYGPAAIRFDGASSESLAQALADLLSAGGRACRAERVRQGLAQAEHYSAAALGPRWLELLHRARAGFRQR